ncbi:MAG: hypothetical protein P8Z80_04195 [Pseudolabrys sp.]|jgi:hypothetical protein
MSTDWRFASDSIAHTGKFVADLIVFKATLGPTDATPERRRIILLRKCSYSSILSPLSVSHSRFRRAWKNI